MTFPEWSSILGYPLGVLTAVLAYKQFRISKKIDNENHLFEVKISSYEAILSIITDYIWQHEDARKLMYDFQKELDTIKAKGGEQTVMDEFNIRKNEATKQLREKDYHLDRTKEKILPHLLVSSNTVVAEINNFWINVNDKTNQSERQRMTYKEKVAVIENDFDKMYDMANKILAAMRKDLNIDDLHFSLERRIKGEGLYYIFTGWEKREY